MSDREAGTATDKQPTDRVVKDPGSGGNGGPLIKFETRSNRVKGISFHPKRSWVLCGLHNGAVQIWDYRMGTLIDRFEEHEGPVRGVDFHFTQPLFATGGDDYKIKVWNFKLRRCLFTLLGHLDYIRTVQFHRHQPWIVSASDDQTLRIWNWQSRCCISVLTGHNHYVMSAQFHPKEDLVVSASLDLTIRCWDVSGLRTKKQESGIALPQDLFGSNDVVVKFILEGHEKGVNWASFHPTKPYIVSGADDRSIRIWKMDETRTRGHEIEQLRGHTNNVSCVTYFKDLIVSNSEDRTIRVWDFNIRTNIQTYRREHDRFWVLATHPESNLLGAGHDTGLIVFKLERERPAHCLVGNMLYWVKDRTLHGYDFTTNTETSPMVTRRHNAPPVSLSCNPADSTAVLWYDYDGGVFELFTIPKPGSVVLSDDVKKGFYMSAVFFGANKFAALDKTRQVILRNNNNDITKVLPPVHDADRLFEGPQGMLLCRAEEKVYMFHVAQRSVVAECAASKVRYVVWDKDYNKVALLSKHTIVVATRKLKSIVTANVHEASRIKSACFDEDRDVLLYATQNHLKYLSLRSGETGTLKTIEAPIYLIRCKGDKIWFLSRSVATLVEEKIDSTEIDFKTAIHQERFRDVVKLIQEKKVHGRALVAYLHKHGFSEIAMHFVSDPLIRFNLVIECGAIDIAKSIAQEVNTPNCWRQLAEAAMKYGDIQTAQLANAKLQNMASLGFQCTLTGNLAALDQIVRKSSDDSFRLQYSLFTGDVENRIVLLENAGQLPLAYSLAMSNGMAERAEELLTKMKPEVAERCKAMPVRRADPVPPVEPCVDNWPLLPMQETYVMRMLREPKALDMETDAVKPEKGAWGDELDEELGDEPKAGEDVVVQAGEEGGAAANIGGGEWEDDLEIDSMMPAPAEAAQATKAGFVMPREGESLHKHWVDNSQHVAFHVAGGSFATAIQLLQRQIGLTNPEPLQPYFMQLWASCNGTLPACSMLPTHTYSAATVPSSADYNGKHQPMLPNLLPVLTDRVKQGYQATTEGRFTEALRLFRSCLHQLIFCIADTPEQENEVRDILNVAREYVTALEVEMKRKETTDPTRVVELAAYFTHFKLQNSHLILSLGQAMSQAFKVKNMKTAGILARRLLDLDPPQERAEKARKVVQMAESNPTDALKLDYDDRNPFTLCTVSKKPVYRGTVQLVRCSYCYSPAHPDHSGVECTVCKIAKYGGISSGLMSRLK